MRKKVLLVTDSHGTNYGIDNSYTELLLNDGEYCITQVSYGGVPLDFFINEVKGINGNFDIAIVQVGNPDVHPRMPSKILKFIRNKGIELCRDSLFSVPPKLEFTYFIRFPLFLVRLIFTRFYKEYYNSISDIQHKFKIIVETLESKSQRVIIFPLFKVHPFVYGQTHNKNVEEINNFLNNNYNGEFLKDEIIEFSFYSKFYNFDWFHFNNIYHEKIYKLLKDSIGGNK